MKVHPKGQVVIPAEVRKRLGIEIGDELEVEVIPEEGKLELRRHRPAKPVHWPVRWRSTRVASVSLPGAAWETCFAEVSSEMPNPVDTNVIIRYLVENPSTIAARFRGVFSFFEKLESGERTALLALLVLFQSYFVMTSYYEVPRAEAAAKLRDLLAFRGLTVPEKSVLRTCLDTLSRRSVDPVDANLSAMCTSKQLAGVYSFDDRLSRLGTAVLPVD
jgi:AbrB family looped-hinge helix DNA binding protein